MKKAGSNPQSVGFPAGRCGQLASLRNGLLLRGGLLLVMRAEAGLAEDLLVPHQHHLPVVVPRRDLRLDVGLVEEAASLRGEAVHDRLRDDLPSHADVLRAGNHRTVAHRCLLCAHDLSPPRLVVVRSRSLNPVQHTKSNRLDSLCFTGKTTQNHTINEVICQ